MLEEMPEEKYAKNNYAEITKEIIELRRENARLIEMCSTRFDIINSLELRIEGLKEDNKKLLKYIEERSINDKNTVRLSTKNDKIFT